jgi:hypothetical protein
MSIFPEVAPAVVAVTFFTRKEYPMRFDAVLAFVKAAPI